MNITFDPSLFTNERCKSIGEKELTFSNELTQFQQNLVNFSSGFESQDIIERTFYSIQDRFQELSEQVNLISSEGEDEENTQVLTHFISVIQPNWEECEKTFHSTIETAQKEFARMQFNQSIISNLEVKINSSIASAQQPQQAIHQSVLCWIDALALNITDRVHCRELIKQLPSIQHSIQNRGFNPNVIERLFPQEISTRLSQYLITNPQVEFEVLLGELTEEISIPLHQMLTVPFQLYKQQLIVEIESGIITEELLQKLSSVKVFSEKIQVEGNELSDLGEKLIHSFFHHFPSLTFITIINQFYSILPEGRFKQSFKNTFFKEMKKSFLHPNSLEILFRYGQSTDLPIQIKKCMELHCLQLNMIHGERNENSVNSFFVQLEKCLQELRLAELRKHAQSNLFLLSYLEILKIVAEETNSKWLNTHTGFLRIINFESFPILKHLIDGYVYLDELNHEQTSKLKSYIEALEQFQSALFHVPQDYKTQENPLIILISETIGNDVSNYFSKQSGFINITKKLEKIIKLKTLLNEITDSLGMDPIPIEIAPIMNNPTEEERIEHEELLRRYDLA